MRSVAHLFSVLAGLLAALPAQHDGDRDGDGLSDFAEVHKYRTDPDRADSDGDGVPDGDWRERREFQYTVRTVVQVMRPVTVAHLCDDHQDVRVLDETDAHVELEVIHYPFTTVADTIVADPDWRRTAAGMDAWTRPGPTADWTPAMRDALVEALRADGIDVAALDDRTLVQRVSRWLCERTRSNDCFLGFVTAFDADGEPFVPADLAAAVALAPDRLAAGWSRDVSARGMFEQRRRGSCTSTAIYLNGCLRALGIPTRIVLCIPVVDANDARERAMLAGLQHHALRARVQRSIDRIVGSWASHTFNEVFVGGRWHRLDGDVLGRGIADAQPFGLITHVATFADWADARMAETIGRRQTLRRYDDTFGGPNPYSTLTLRDEFGPHCALPNDPPPPPTAKLTAVHWGDGPDVPAAIRQWFGERDVFGLVARIEGPADRTALPAFLAGTDCHAELVAPGRPPLGVDLDAGCFWGRGDHTLVVVRLARDAFDPTVRYEFALRAGDARFAWSDVAAVPVPRRP